MTVCAVLYAVQPWETAKLSEGKLFSPDKVGCGGMEVLTALHVGSLPHRQYHVQA